ncbi:MAG: hypothetical protein H7Z21_15330 [Hymenobacter sp.]|nr:hypothetical protein [Hymenobacter sp.]
MTITRILQEIQKLPLAEKLEVVEKTLETIRQDRRHGLEQAVSELSDEYSTNSELTAFTQLDTDPFHEAR